MSSWLDDLEAPLVRLVIGGLEQLAHAAVHKLRGDASDPDGAMIAADLKRRALAAAVDAIETGARHHAVMLGLEHRVDDMQTAAADVLNAFTVKGDIPALGLDIEVIRPGNTDDIVTKPGDG